MSPLLLIRQYREGDRLECEELIKDYVMSSASKIFISCIFKEITIQAIVIVWAILFIFIGLPLSLCALSIPACLICLLVCCYMNCFINAVELAKEKPKDCWIVESFEPFLSLYHNKQNISFEIYYNEIPFECCNNLNAYQKQIIGCVNLEKHFSIANSVWLRRIAISPEYSFENIAGYLIDFLIKRAFQSNYKFMELTLTEWQEIERDFLTKIGFTVRQVYSKRIIGSSLCVAKALTSIELSEYCKAKDVVTVEYKKQ